MRVIDDFLILSRLLDDDIELICDFLVHHIPKKTRIHKRSKIKRFIENANYMKLQKQIDIALDIPIYKYTHFKVFYGMNNEV